MSLSRSREWRRLEESERMPGRPLAEEVES